MKVDKEVKDEAQSLSEELGFTLSAVTNALLKQFIRERRLEVGMQHHLKPEIENEVERIIARMQGGDGISPTFETHADLEAYYRDRRKA